MCVCIPNAEGEMKPRCLCPDGYKKEKYGSCAPIEDILEDDEHGKPLVKRNEPKDHSHVGVAWMKERCLGGDGCLNGGQCLIKNEHGRVVKIVCKCKTPYEGLRCERLNPVKALAAQFEASSTLLCKTSYDGLRCEGLNPVNAPAAQLEASATLLCKTSYDGLRCEGFNPVKALAALNLSPTKFWMILFFILLILIFFIAVFMFLYRHIRKNNKQTTSLSASIEKRLMKLTPISNPLFDNDQLSYNSAQEEPSADATAIRSDSFATYESIR